MGKPKKGRKVDQDEDFEATVSQAKEVDNEINTKSKTKKEKKARGAVLNDLEGKGQENNKKNKNNSENESDETSEEVQVKAVKNKAKKKVMPDVEVPKMGKQSSQSRKKTKMLELDSDEEISFVATAKGFSALAISDDDDDDEPAEVEVEDEDDEQEEEVEVVQKKTGKQGKKNKRKKKEEDEDDIDKILAELEMQYSGITPPTTNKVPQAPPSEVPPKENNKKKLGKKNEVQEEVDEDVVETKSAAQKKKEEKKRNKKIAYEEMKAKAEVQRESSQEGTPEPTFSAELKPPPPAETEATPTPESVPTAENAEEADEEEISDNKKKGKKKPRKALAAMQEALLRIKQEEERLAAEEAEKIRKAEEAEIQRQERIRLQNEMQQQKKQREKEKKEKLKAEGKLLNAKQKIQKAKALEMLASFNINMSTKNAQAEKVKQKPKHVPKQNPPQQQKPPPQPPKQLPETNETATVPKSVEVKIVDTEVKEPKVEIKDHIKDSWDMDSDNEDEKTDESCKTKSEEITKPDTPHEIEAVNEVFDINRQKSKDSVADSKFSEANSDSSEEDSDDNIEQKTHEEIKQQRAATRIQKRQEEAENSRSVDELRAPVVCVLGHVDTGKTKILDKLRRTNVQDGEAGGITQQIGATNVPMDAIKDQAKVVKGFSQLKLTLPGLLIIDTPGHESFSNLRSRGSSLCDIAILVVDIMHGLEPQTIESINLLKKRKTPFIVALNKIDRLYDWETMSKKDIRDVIKNQAPNTQLEFEQRTKEVILQFSEQGLNAAMFYNNPDVRTYVSLVPTSAITGEGMGNLLALIIELCQNMLAKRLMFSKELQATVLEVKAIPGHGTTIDVILINGYLREGETIVLAGTDAPIVTQIRSLLMPQPLKELRVKNAYVEYKEIKAAQGVKLTAKELEKVIAGLNLRIAYKPDEIDILREEVVNELKQALSIIKLQDRGVYVQASTLGSLEALLEFLKQSSIPYSNIRIGPVVKKDVMKASTMLEHEPQYAVILAFDVKIERDAQELADHLGVTIFQADIIYHLFDKFTAFRNDIKAKKREEFKSVAVFPCRLKVLPQFVFNSRDPIVVGVMVEAGILREGTPICVPSKEFVDLGVVTSIENNHKNVDSARKGHEVCIKIEPLPGESPKMFGRHFDETDFLVSKISRPSIDACKDYFRDDLLKTDWQLMVELKKLFQIL